MGIDVIAGSKGARKSTTPISRDASSFAVAALALAASGALGCRSGVDIAASSGAASGSGSGAGQGGEPSCRTPGPGPGCTAFPAPVWARRFGTEGSGDGGGIGVALDDQRSAYSAGFFTGSSDFGGGPLVAQGHYDAYIVATGATGDYRWSHTYGVAKRSFAAYAVAVDAASDVFVTGYAEDVVDFGGGPRCTPGLAQQLFVLKLDADGHHVWSACFGGADWGSVGLESYLAPDGAGGAVVAAPLVTDDGAKSLFGHKLTGSSALLKIDESGALAWKQVIGVAGGSGQVYGGSVAVGPDRTIYVIGNVNGTVELGGAPLVGGGDPTFSTSFLAKLDTDGGHVWSKVFQAGAGGHGDVAGVSVDAAGRCVIVASLDGPIDFGCGPPSLDAGAGVAEVVSFDSAGTALWARFRGGMSAGRVATDIDGTIAVTFDVTPNAPYPGDDFGCGPGPHDDIDYAIVRLDAAGETLGQGWTRDGAMPGLAARGGAIAVTGQVLGPPGSPASTVIDGVGPTGMGASFTAVIRP